MRHVLVDPIFEMLFPFFTPRGHGKFRFSEILVELFKFLSFVFSCLWGFQIICYFSHFQPTLHF